MGVEFEGGVVLGADSRTTSGSYISHRASNKIHSVSENIWVCVSGSAASSQAIIRYLRWYLSMHIIETNDPALVRTAASLAQQLCYNNKNQLLSALIVGGWDRIDGGQIYQIPLGGMLQRESIALGGSGSVYIMGYCDKEFKENMSRDACVKFVSGALALAMARDGSSGGVINTVVISKDGFYRNTIPDNQIPGLA